MRALLLLLLAGYRQRGPPLSPTSPRTRSVTREAERFAQGTLPEPRGGDGQPAEVPQRAWDMIRASWAEGDTREGEGSLKPALRHSLSRIVCETVSARDWTLLRDVVHWSRAEEDVRLPSSGVCVGRQMEYEWSLRTRHSEPYDAAKGFDDVCCRREGAIQLIDVLGPPSSAAAEYGSRSVSAGQQEVLRVLADHMGRLEWCMEWCGDDADRWSALLQTSVQTGNTLKIVESMEARGIVTPRALNLALRRSIGIVGLDASIATFFSEALRRRDGDAASFMASMNKNLTDETTFNTVAGCLLRSCSKDIASRNILTSRSSLQRSADAARETDARPPAPAAAPRAAADGGAGAAEEDAVDSPAAAGDLSPEALLAASAISSPWVGAPRAPDAAADVGPAGADETSVPRAAFGTLEETLAMVRGHFPLTVERCNTELTALIRGRSSDDAWELFRDMLNGARGLPPPDAATLTIMCGHLCRTRPEQAKGFVEFLRTDGRISVALPDTLLTQVKDDPAEIVRTCRKSHQRALRDGGAPATNLCNAAVRRLCDLGSPHGALEAFLAIHGDAFPPDFVSTNVLVKGLCLRRFAVKELRPRDDPGRRGTGRFRSMHRWLTVRPGTSWPSARAVLLRNAQRWTGLEVSLFLVSSLGARSNSRSTASICNALGTLDDNIRIDGMTIPAFTEAFVERCGLPAADDFTRAMTGPLAAAMLRTVRFDGRRTAEVYKGLLPQVQNGSTALNARQRDAFRVATWALEKVLEEEHRGPLSGAGDKLEDQLAKSQSEHVSRLQHALLYNAGCCFNPRLALTAIYAMKGSAIVTSATTRQTWIRGLKEHKTELKRLERWGDRPVPQKKWNFIDRQCARLIDVECGYVRRGGDNESTSIEKIRIRF